MKNLLKCISVTIILYKLLFFNCKAQCAQDFVDNTIVGNYSSQNGYNLPTVGTIRLLVVFLEIDYDSVDPSAPQDPNPNSNSNWSIGTLPIWKNDLLERFQFTSTNAKLSKYYYKASSGSLVLLGDYFVS